ncbi:DUF5713 family protein [Streptomyces sp. NPDC050844]|uniref:DUF5713 family protein n=1 Tax=Streptomyces sp. NPDC050844 TaxID=3155790 RepID=UPI0033F1EA33
MPVSNQQVVRHGFLGELYGDSYYPGHLLDKGKAILLALEEEFVAADSEIETIARDAIGEDFAFVASAYGFADADVEELIAAREW